MTAQPETSAHTILKNIQIRSSRIHHGDEYFHGLDSKTDIPIQVNYISMLLLAVAGHWIQLRH